MPLGLPVKKAKADNPLASAEEPTPHASSMRLLRSTLNDEGHIDRGQRALRVFGISGQRHAEALTTDADSTAAAVAD